MSFPIHAVYTWIDASDKRRQSERAKWLQQYQIGESVRRLPVDFVEGEPRHTELYFSLHALQVFAPWIQTVWIVTQRPHVPAFLDEFPRARVVHHDEMFERSDVLPTFSSRAIEANLHRIPGIAEYFLYFNDDMFLGQPVAPEDFFIKQKGTILPILRTLKPWKPMATPLKTLPPRLEHVKDVQTVQCKKDNAYVNSNRRVHSWLNKSFVCDPLRTNLAHQVTPLTVSSMKAASFALSDEWNHMISSRFRDSATMSPIPLTLFYAFYKGNAAVLPASKDRLRRIWGSADDGELMWQVLKHRPHLFCLNDIGPHLGESVVRVYWKGLHKLIKEARDNTRETLKDGE